MNIAIIGANGQIGKILTTQLAANQHKVSAVIRKPEQAEALEKVGAQAVLADLEGSVEDLTKVLQGADAVVFAAGSGGSTGADKTLLIDLDGAVKSMEAAEKAGISRFVLVSALYAEDRTQWPDDMKTYYVAKHYADKMLEASSLDYTIIRPGGLLNDSGTGKVKLVEHLGEKGSIPREDVASVIASILDQSSTYRRSFDLVSGDDAIEEAIQSV
ncbi:SDR family oxidoreductase [Paenibacillus sp. PsM32]|uniref:SDR family oxidoreductase n=1 Tax=Paenibacillus kyungheensis TaxID=1452732 RepID=A0AAX3LX81_9BACL|nr:MULTISPECIES: SDR family oxidoreductase [Paenibacillus]MDN4619602.1 SDR family oxidoreductase [Paenibacillus sp. PsM32]WCT54462.1 SDR family oxidoreductase [Paenibacillus kyungheensis]WDF52408.1 SDR family oxidoreductase [Paenibacillus sp. KACC 21273]